MAGSPVNRELSILVSPEAGTVSALLNMPPGAGAVLVLGHGAGAGMRHRTLEALAEGLAARGIGTLRYQFPFRERGGGRDSQAVSLATVRAAVGAAVDVAAGLPVLAGGHSFGGRMTSLASAREGAPDGGDDPMDLLRGLVYFNFPLHPPGKPATIRAAHLGAIRTPQLFVSGTRDTLARRDLLEATVGGLGAGAQLHLIETADHGFKVLKRSRSSVEDPIREACRIVREWWDGLV